MKHLVWIIIAAGILYACNPRAEYIIMGELADADGLKVILAKVTAGSDNLVRIDSCVVKKGKFRMKGSLDYPEYCVLYVGDNGPLPLIVENTVINVAFNLKNIQDSEVTGSNETDLFVECSQKIAEFGETFGKIQDEYKSMILSEESDAEKEKEFVDRMEQIQQQLLEFMKEFAAEHPNNIFTALLVLFHLSNDIEPEELEAYADGFDAVNSQSPWVQSIRDKVASARCLAIGQPFIDLKMPAPDGTEIALSDYAGKDKYVLIDFWASWCTPCRIANPQVVKLYHKYKDKGFEIVGVSFDKGNTEWSKAIEDDALVWPQMSDLKFWQSEGAKLYMVTSIPYTVLLDKDGTILAKGLQPDELEKKLAELME